MQYKYLGFDVAVEPDNETTWAYSIRKGGFYAGCWNLIGPESASDSAELLIDVIVENIDL